MIAGYTQLLKRRYPDRFDGEAGEFMDYVVQGAGRMRRLIDDLLRYSRVGRDTQDAAEVDLNEVLKEVRANLHELIREKGAVLTCEKLPTIVAGRTSMLQIFQNLVANALKFCGKEAPRVDVRASEREDGWEFSVADNGIGIDPRYFDRIFVIFQRLHAREQYGGTGMGLSICKRIIDGLGGRIWVESELGHGARFHFFLPKQAT
jgi:two-component system, chemotaxis family, sensor kinase Cph1